VRDPTDVSVSETYLIIGNFCYRLAVGQSENHSITLDAKHDSTGNGTS
jgi:hypothetical protein